MIIEFWLDCPNDHTLILVGCTTDIMTSDHSPVFGSFEVGVASQFVSKQGIQSKVHWILAVFCLMVVSEFHLVSRQIQTVHLKVGYRSWIVWPHCWQNPGPSSLLSTILVAWKVSLSCWKIMLKSTDSKKEEIQLCMGLLDIYRNS